MTGCFCSCYTFLSINIAKFDVREHLHIEITIYDSHQIIRIQILLEIIPVSFIFPRSFNQIYKELKCVMKSLENTLTSECL